jgi:hypothetical protein
VSDHCGRGQHETVQWLGWRVSLRGESAENGYSSGKVATVLGSTVQSQGKKGQKKTNDVCAKKKRQNHIPYYCQVRQTPSSAKRRVSNILYW